jgi:holo-[acyl-carrier protein] synthase
MPIVGLGIDVIEIHRIEETVRRYGEKFLSRIFTKNERELCLSRKDSASCLAARFAAKEALYKALAAFHNDDFLLPFHDVEISKDDSGKPFFVFHDKALQTIKTIKIENIHLSITHSRIFAAAIVIIEM